MGGARGRTQTCSIACNAWNDQPWNVRAVVVAFNTGKHRRLANRRKEAGLEVGANQHVMADGAGQVLLDNCDAVPLP